MKGIGLSQEDAQVQKKLRRINQGGKLLTVIHPESRLLMWCVYMYWTWHWCDTGLEESCAAGICQQAGCAWSNDAGGDFTATWTDANQRPWLAHTVVLCPHWTRVCTDSVVVCCEFLAYVPRKLTARFISLFSWPSSLELLQLRPGFSKESRHHFLFSSQILCKPGLSSFLSAFFLHLFRKRTFGKWHKFSQAGCLSGHQMDSIQAMKETQSTDANQGNSSTGAPHLDPGL